MLSKPLLQHPDHGIPPSTHLRTGPHRTGCPLGHINWGSSRFWEEVRGGRKSWTNIANILCGLLKPDGLTPDVEILDLPFKRETLGIFTSYTMSTKVWESSPERFPTILTWSRSEKMDFIREVRSCTERGWLISHFQAGRSLHAFTQLNQLIQGNKDEQKTDRVRRVCTTSETSGCK